ncbi:hypothetical protein SY85_06655 [Flavisolibacter tropicus]|uniref:Lipoprotein n=2 Tax=Flavisolibacter tropicus TaxID=1492898 RepID=A0A172TT13_9BACT|nr:hypothetical protein SY85_06655 [Flavisolibacter tropicus]
MQDMVRYGIFLLLLAIAACNNNKKTTTKEEESDTAFNYETFTGWFKGASLPYQLTDSGLLNNEDTTTIRSEVFAHYISDSVKTKLFGKTTAKVKYVPLVYFKQANNEQYYVVKAVSGGKKTAMLAVFDKDAQFLNAFPFLVPDADPKTSQVSSIDKYFSINRAISRKMPNDVIVEGKDVYAFDGATKSFALVMTDVLEDNNQELINPIDTLSKKTPFAGDYIKDKRNIVSIRDGHNEKEIQFFVHFERMNGECNGELKGTALMTSSKTAVYNQGGDPCRLEFHFTSNSVRLKEAEGCGQYRGVKCIIEGSFPKKRESKTESGKQKKS